jgi:hypothetical protein
LLLLPFENDATKGLQKDLDENTAAWLRVPTALVTKYQRLGDGSESEDDMDETDYRTVTIKIDVSYS